MYKIALLLFIICRVNGLRQQISPIAQLNRGINLRGHFIQF